MLLNTGSTQEEGNHPDMTENLLTGTQALEDANHCLF